MPLVKDFIENSVSEEQYNSELHPKILNTSESPLDSASGNIDAQISDQINTTKNLQGIHTHSSQAGGNKERQYIVMDNKIECPIIVSSNSKSAAKKAFELIHTELKIKKRKLIIWDVKNSRRYKYSLVKGKLKREKL